MLLKPLRHLSRIGGDHMIDAKIAKVQGRALTIITNTAVYLIKKLEPVVLGYCRERRKVLISRLGNYRHAGIA